MSSVIDAPWILRCVQKRCDVPREHWMNTYWATAPGERGLAACEPLGTTFPSTLSSSPHLYVFLFKGTLSNIYCWLINIGLNGQQHCYLCLKEAYLTHAFFSAQNPDWGQGLSGKAGGAPVSRIFPLTLIFKTTVAYSWGWADSCTEQRSSTPGVKGGEALLVPKESHRLLLVLVLEQNVSTHKK